MNSQSYLASRDYPRLLMALTVLTTALTAFLFSAFLLRMGVDTLSIRYASAIAFAHGVLLAMIALQKRSKRLAGSTRENPDLVASVAVLLIVVAELGASIYLIAGTQALYAEFLLAVVVSSELLRRIPDSGHSGWTLSTYRQARTTAMALTAIFGLAGWAMQRAVPGVTTLNQVIHHYLR